MLDKNCSDLAKNNKNLEADLMEQKSTLKIVTKVIQCHVCFLRPQCVPLTQNRRLVLEISVDVPLLSCRMLCCTAGP